MKNRISLLTALLLLFVNLVNAQNPMLNISAPVEVADWNIYGNVRPRVALTAGQIPVVAFGNSNPQEQYVARWNGSTFGTPVKINADGHQPYITHWVGIEIATQGDLVYLVYENAPLQSGHVFLVKSIDGGQSFIDPVRVDDIGNGIAVFPSLSISTNGNPIVAFMRNESNWADPRYVVTVSDDGGATFQPDVNGSGIAPHEVCDCCPAGLLSLPNKIILSFRNNDNNLRDIWLTASTDGGATFPDGNDIDPNGWVIGACPSSGPQTMLSGDTLVTVWMSEGQGQVRVYAGTATLSDLQPGFANEISEPADPFAVQNYPRIAGNGDTIGVVWQEMMNSNADIRFSWSVNGTVGLMDNVQTVHSSSTGDQLAPDIAFANGTFHIVYTDDAVGHVTYQTATIGSSTGITAKSSITPRVSPNPFNHQTRITFEQEVEFAQLYNLQGELIRNYSLQGTKQLLLEKGELNSGVYFLHFAANNIKFRPFKLIIH